MQSQQEDVTEDTRRHALVAVALHRIRRNRYDRNLSE